MTSCHHLQEVGSIIRELTNAYLLAELIKKKKQVGTKPVLHITKRAKHNLDSTYLWHCRLAHISKKRIEKLQHEGLLKSTDDESFDQCFTPPYTPQHNGVSERRNRTLLDMVQSMMNLTTLPLSFWDYALESATRILNMVLTKKVDKTPYELWYEKVPNLSYLKVWGCEALVKRDTPNKLKQRSVKCIFIEYPKEMMGCYFYFSPENKIIIAMYAKFFKKCPISQEISRRAVDLEEIQEEEDTTPSKITSNIPQEVEGFEPPQPPQEEVIPIRDLGEPANYKAPMLDPESKKWVDVMNVEMQSMIDNMKSMQASRSIYGLKQASRSWNKKFDEEIKRDRSKRLIGLGQNAYMDKILKRYKMDNSKRGHIPMQERLDLNKTQGASTPKEVKRMQNIPYASAVGSIMYVVRCTRPDVAFAQNITSRFQQNPAEMEAVWIRKFISRLGIVPTINELIKMFCDDSATLLIANEPGVQMGARHYHRRYLLKVHTDDNLAYPFTKALPKGKLTQHARSMGLHKNPDCNKSETNESDKEENHVKQDSSVSTIVVEPQISTDLIDEVKSLKGSQLKQIVKINMLEKRLVESKQEVQQLKNRICSLEHGSQHVVDPVEVDDHESIKSQSNFDESVYIKYASAAISNGELYHFGGEGFHTDLVSPTAIPSPKHPFRKLRNMVNTNTFIEANWHRKNKYLGHQQQWYQSKIQGKPLRRITQTEFTQR
ncbi:retrotransposon protein, putative, ty1-copia subclass [Tanacetum coccineum]